MNRPARRHLPSLLPLLSLGLLPTQAIAQTPAIHPEYNASIDPQLPLEEGWVNPPRLARTRVWWWWLNGNTDKPTITRDLEAMKAVGIGGANIIDAGGDTQEGNQRVPHGPDFASPAWIDLFKHALAEAERLDLEMGFNIQSGWNLGGPRVTPAESSKKVTFSRTSIDGGKPIDLTLPTGPTTGGFYMDTAVLAVPAPPIHSPILTQTTASSSQPNQPASLATDGSPDSFWVSSGKNQGQGPTTQRPEWLDLTFATPQSVSQITLHPRPGYGPTAGHIETITPNSRKSLASFTSDGSRPVTIEFPPTLTGNLRVILTNSADPKEKPSRNVQIAEITIANSSSQIHPPPAPAPGPRQLAQKAYFQYPGAFTATTAWHLLDPGPTVPNETPIPPNQVRDLSPLMDASGRLRWNAPPGRWEILRFGSTLSGAHVSTHSENAGGLAIDYLDRSTLDAYWQKTLDPILNAVKPHIGTSLRFLHTDSWELGPVNWTRLMPAEFKQLRGYDLTSWLPVLAGHTIGSREQTDRFLNDFRRTLADLMAANKYAGFSAKAHALGLGTHPEAGGPHAGPMDALRNLGISDVPMGEFWSTSPRHRTRDEQRFFVKQTTSAAHTYGRRISLAEAFTNIGRHWQHDPRSLKPTFDQAACEGHNLTMWHTFPSSSPQHGLPGAAYFAGEHFNPNITWWNQSSAFIAYMNRCHFLLQQGLGTADVLHFYGENVPSFVRLKSDDPAKCLPGYDYDVIDAHALIHRVRTNPDGAAILPEGKRYQLISLVPHNAITLTTLKHLANLVEQGATLVGPRPTRPFSLTGGPTAEDAFFSTVNHLWGPDPKGTKHVGKGRVIWGQTTREVLQADGIPEDFSWSGGDKNTYIDFIHRQTRDTQIYFVANRNDRPENLTLHFRVTGKIPEIWDPVTDSRRDASRFTTSGKQTAIPLSLQPHESLFFLFRKPMPEANAGNGPPNTPTFEERSTLDGPWEVAFEPSRGAPASIRFDSLTDWTTHPLEGIRHFSGYATYQKTFTAPATEGRVFLDLGAVKNLCEVRLNGADLGVWWSTPFRREITATLKPGPNTLEVKVVNLWCNRIIGDARLPPAQRLTRTNITRLTKDTPLEPSGLLGPVKLLHTR